MTWDIPPVDLERLRRHHAEVRAAEATLRSAIAQVELERQRFRHAAVEVSQRVAPGVQALSLDLHAGRFVVQEGDHDHVPR